MSDTIWLEISDGISKTGGERDNSIMLKLGEELDILAKKLGVPKLSSFYDNSALAHEYADELEDVDIPPIDPVWFDAGVGGQAVGALLSALREGTAELGTKLDASHHDWPAMLLQELEYCRAALTEAARHGQRFHFLVVP